MEHSRMSARQTEYHRRGSADPVVHSQFSGWRPCRLAVVPSAAKHRSHSPGSDPADEDAPVNIVEVLDEVVETVGAEARLESVGATRIESERSPAGG
jgi:hypothetical protein